MKKVYAVVGSCLLSVLLLSSVAQAWPRPGMGRLAGSWVGCLEDGQVTLRITRDGYIWITDSNDEDIVRTYCDSFKRVNGVKYLPEDLILICPYTDSGGNPDPTDLYTYAFHFLDRDHISYRPYFDYETYVLKRVGSKPSMACANAKGAPVRQLADRLLGRAGPSRAR